MGATSTGGGFISSSSQIADNVIVAADILDESITLAKLTPTGTATHVLTSNGEGANPEYKVIPSGTGANYEYLGLTTLGSPNSEIDFSGITADTYSGFFVAYRAVANGTTAGGFQLNGDTTSGNYHSNILERASTTITAANRAVSTFNVNNASNITSGNEVNGILTITNLGSGNRTMVSQGTNGSLTGITDSHTNTGFWKSTTQIASIKLKATAGSWDTGSTISVWGMKKI